MVLFELERVKRILEITDNADDTLLNQLGLGALQTFQNYLLSKMDELPAEADETDDMKNAVAYKTASRFLLSRKDYEGSDRWKSEYDLAIEGIRMGIDDAQEDEFIIVERW